MFEKNTKLQVFRFKMWFKISKFPVFKKMAPKATKTQVFQKGGQKFSKLRNLKTAPKRNQNQCFQVLFVSVFKIQDFQKICQEVIMIKVFRKYGIMSVMKVDMPPRQMSPTRRKRIWRWPTFLCSMMNHANRRLWCSETREKFGRNWRIRSKLSQRLLLTLNWQNCKIFE